MMGTECVVPLSVENIKLNSMGLEVNGHVETCDLDESTPGNDVNEIADIRMNSDEEESSPISNNVVNGDHRRVRWRYKKRGEMTPNELALARERDRLQSRRRREKAELLRLENLKEHEIKVEDATHSTPIAMLDECCSQKEIDIEKTNYDSSTSASSATQRRRNIKKRNRSDMSPEELARLRERERKAQQNRRDRMRAQKRQASGWHDEDAAWEAFLNEADEPVSKEHSPSSHVPSMVCDPDEKPFVPKKSMPEAARDQPSLGWRTDVQIESDAVQSFAASAPESEKHCYSSEVSLQPDDIDVAPVDTASHSSPDSPNNRSLLYSSDENSKDGSFKDDQAAGKKCGRRHYLPTDELERIRKRERDAKRKQREKARLLTSEKLTAGGATSFVASGVQASSRYHAVSPIGSRTDLDVKVRACPSSKIERASSIDRTNSDAEVRNHRLTGVSTTDRSGKCVGLDEGRYEGSCSPTESNETSVSHAEHFRHINYPIPHHALSSHDFRKHAEVMLASPHSRSMGHVVPPHMPHHSPHHVYQPIVYLAPEVAPIPYGHGVSAFPHMESVQKASPTSHGSSQQPTSEKKRLVSRNVDRKKLSEDELEELRRRERDYQRERRARIRMEKANAQVSSEKQATVKHSSDEEDKATFYLPDAAFMSPRVIHHPQHPEKDYAAQRPPSNHHLPQDEQFLSSHHQCLGSSSKSLQSMEACGRAGKGEHVRDGVSCSSIDGVAQTRLHLQFEAGLEDGQRNRATYSSQDKEGEIENPNGRNALPSKKAEAWRSSSEIESRLKKTLVFSSGSALPHAPFPREAGKEAKKNILEHICSSLKGLDDPPRDARLDAATPGVFREEAPSKDADEHLDQDDDDERLVIVQPNIEETVRENGKRCESDRMLEGDDRMSVLKEDLMKDIKDEPSSTSSSQAEEQLSEDKWRYWKEGLTEDQLERRRKSNREAQRRRRARLRMQGHSGDEHSYYDSVIDAHGLKQEPTYDPTAGVSVPSDAPKRLSSAVDEFQDRRNMPYFDLEIEKCKLRPELESAYKSVCGSPSLEGDGRTVRAKGCRVKLTPSLRGGDVGFDERYPLREEETRVGRYAYAEPFSRPYITGDQHRHYYSSVLQRTVQHHKRHHDFYYPDHHASHHGDHGPMHHLQGYYYPEIYHPHHHHHNYYEKLTPRPIPVYRHEREWRDRDRYELGEDGRHPNREANHEFRKVHQRVRSPLDYPEEKEAVPQIKTECRPRARSPMADQAGANKSLPHAEDTSTAKQSGRKRKQFVPRRVMSTSQSFSTGRSSDEDEDRALARETRRVPDVTEEADLRGSDFHQLHGRGVSFKFRALDPNDNRMEAHHYDDCVQAVGGD